MSKPNQIWEENQRLETLSLVQDPPKYRMVICSPWYFWCTHEDYTGAASSYHHLETYGLWASSLKSNLPSSSLISRISCHSNSKIFVLFDLLQNGQLLKWCARSFQLPSNYRPKPLMVTLTILTK